MMSRTGDNDKTIDSTSGAHPDVASNEENASIPSSEENTATKLPILKLPTSKLRKRKSKSWVWEHFDKNNDVSDPRATCKYCTMSFTCPSSTDTSRLSNHLSRCKKYPYNVDKGQSTLDFTPAPKLDADSCVDLLTDWKSDQEECRNGLVRMTITNELGFVFVEHQGFRGFRRVMQPRLRFILPSRRTIGRDCYVIYKEEISELKKNFKKLSSKICLTTNTWTSVQNLSYLCLIAHFIDDDWKLHKRIIGFCPISDRSGEVIGMAVERCLLHWGIDRVFSVTSSHDVGLQYLKKRLNSWKGTVLGGEYLHVRCVAHILNLIVEDSLSEMHDSILRIRNAIKYVRSSPSRLQKFNKCVEKEKIDFKRHLCLDVETRWNSTYLMLKAAVKFQKAFDLLEMTDKKYTMELTMKSGTPTTDDWGYTRSLLYFLKFFNDVTLSLSGSLHITNNEYMKEIFGIGFMIDSKIDSNDAILRVMALKMKKKFEKYLDVDNFNILLFIALILDPRYKLKCVNFIIENICDATRATKLKDEVKSVLDSLFQSYDTFRASFSGNSSGDEEIDSSFLSDVHDVALDAYLFFKKQQVSDNGGYSKSELDKYLDGYHGKASSSFDILDWWKINAPTYPTLALIARDVLAIPVSTVASESDFITGGRGFDSSWSASTPRLVETLVCVQNWLRCSSQPIHLENILEQTGSHPT
ncbi:zinc finger BED domain-containing protein RICESLEEPER 1-like isoform X1 [Euphorbia lathyris]|uniref:zinc finger BED domain-containing protein RICESLEEPER 1-like isoform X1 n=2 Tax=Euphorbia lathyris TaxID=212925 RepID=UPI0033135D20